MGTKVTAFQFQANERKVVQMYLVCD